MNDLYSQVTYQKPPQAVLDVLHAETAPTVSLDPTRKNLLLIKTARYPSIAELSAPMLRLAGERINPKNNAPHRTPNVTSLAIMPVTGGEKKVITLPPGRIGMPDWSPDGAKFAFQIVREDKVELGVVTVATGTLDLIHNVSLNAAFGDAVSWMPDGKTLLVELEPKDRGLAPTAPTAPDGPTVQETSGRAAPVRTYQDWLQNQHDEALFDYHATSQLAIVELRPLKITPIGQPAIFGAASPSPDGQFLLVSRVQKPYSYLHTRSAFPRIWEVWDTTGKVVKEIHKSPLQDKIPIEGVAVGPRGIRWVASEDATLMWAEARDDGDPRKKVPHRDELFRLAIGQVDTPTAFHKTEHRFMGAGFFSNGQLLVTDFDRDRRWMRSQIFALQGMDKPITIFDRSMQDRYGDPGSPVMHRNDKGRSVIWSTASGDIFLSGLGATPKGDRPFLDQFNFKSGEKKRLFECKDGVYETATLLDANGPKLLIRRESVTEPGNYYLRDGDKEIAITDNKDPVPQIRGIKKQLVTTKRPDGVTISFTLYLPPDYKEGTKYPTVFWAYPREFNTADTAGQVSGSTNRFTTLGGYSHLFFLLQGYVVMDEVSVPIVGEPEKANNTFIEQLTASAKAAIDKAVEMGAVDRDRIGVGGHSYGAFMTANLLAHSDLFRAGIARSGAYNRTLTPFGFQNERRTFWEAPEIYAKMSPFNHANKINEPILLLHGAADDNPGTFPVQSERLYQALRGHGATARLVMLPHEAHGYAAKESIEHVLAEQIAWFDKYVKHAPTRSLP